ncbi:hypothetical protein TPY_0099 [Sulfobacillus acidophilus TPY]|uniref:DUF11 domain-containing protein n=1 Tax=Sulfobacillus acidophilus (strain ATCC 700253 / DSM 10332 / NAL) TaxID=679936 RepID=G8TVM3_SULAD|nr:hypothetical protein TPY_0099 [Sulfobacillus acidophilus TPY]AEW03662.1 hypothetical protein Sulac_0089 [Sulfobacillus acidophilus DSM 10332]
MNGKIGRPTIFGLGMAIALTAIGSEAAQAAALPPSSSDFELTGLSATPVKGNSNTFDVTVTVTQTQADGSDFTPQVTEETHDFPGTVYFVVENGSVTEGPYSATLTTSPTPGITYPNLGPGPSAPQISASATYQLVLPSSVVLGGGDNLEIYPGSNRQYIFRMGPSSDNSWADDNVSGVGQVTIPYGQLPEVPWAAGIPAIGLGPAGLVWMWRLKSRVI